MKNSQPNLQLDLERMNEKEEDHSFKMDHDPNLPVNDSVELGLLNKSNNKHKLNLENIHKTP